MEAWKHLPFYTHMKQNTFFKPEVQFFFPRLFDGKILYFLISHQNLQVCQLGEQTAIISHHSMSKFKKNPRFSFIKFRALNKGVRFALPAHCSKPVLWYRQSKHMPLVHASSQVASQNFTNMKKLIQMSLPTAAQFSFPLLLWFTSPGEFQALLEMCVIQSLKLSILTI